MKALIVLLSRLYGSLVQIRQLLYKLGLFRSHTLPAPVVSVGNLTLGGTGKTPFVEWVARTLQQAGFEPVILSRGYKGTTGSYPLLVSDGNRVLVGPEICGDEPYLLARRLKDAVVIVGRNRHTAGILTPARLKNPVFILDDGFQHLRLKRDLDLLLVDGTDPLQQQHLLPRGTLREPLSAMSRADAVMVTRTHLVRNPAEIGDQVHLWNPRARVFFCAHEIDGLSDIRRRTIHSLKEFEGQAVVALCAIGNPNQFLQDLERQGLQVLEHFVFRDHHRFSQAELNKILSRSSRLGAARILTTEKDAIRLEKLDFGEGQIFALLIRTVTRDSDEFQRWLLTHISPKPA